MWHPEQKQLAANWTDLLASVLEYGLFVTYKRQVYTVFRKVELLEGVRTLAETIIK